MAGLREFLRDEGRAQRILVDCTVGLMAVGFVIAVAAILFM